MELWLLGKCAPAVRQIDSDEWSWLRALAQTKLRLLRNPQPHWQRAKTAWVPMQTHPSPEVMDVPEAISNNTKSVA